MLGQLLFSLVIGGVSIFIPILCALFYFTHIRLSRPPIGVFNGQDIVLLLGIVTILPFFYLVAPPIVLTCLLIATFTGALFIGLRPFLPIALTWLMVFLLIAANITITILLIHSSSGLLLYWILNSIIVMIAAIEVSNLYVQGGMGLRHTAWFALGVAFYDGFFDLVIPITPRIAARFIGSPLAPAIGFLSSTNGVTIGLGDLLMYCLFIVAAYKGFGRKGIAISIFIITLFGFLLPVLTSFLISALTHHGQSLVPAQVFFGPAAFITYYCFLRKTRERTMAEWYREQDASSKYLIRGSLFR